MNKIEMIVFAFIAVYTTIIGFDFMVFIIKSAPKQSLFSLRFWRFGLLTASLLVYWYLNGMKFL
jgi:hypothetical protein